MKTRLFVILVLFAILTGCSTSPTINQDNHVEADVNSSAVDSKPEYSDNLVEEDTNSPVVDAKAEPDRTVLDVMEYVTATYPEYNTFVFIDGTVHIMNCLDSVNRTSAELAREISSITNSSYELVSVQQVENTSTLFPRGRRTDYISIEDSDNISNQSTNAIVALYHQDDTNLKSLYDQYQVIIRQSVPGVNDYIGKREATITELMGKVEPNAFAGFANLCTNDKKQVFIFPDSSFDFMYSEDALVAQIWETSTPSEVSPYQRGIVDSAVNYFVDAKFWMPGYKELFADVLPEKTLNGFNDNQISISDFKRLVNWKATAYISDGITEDEYEARMDFVVSAFDYALNVLHQNADTLQCQITYDYAQPPAVIALSTEPYLSLFNREVTHIFEEAKYQIECLLFSTISVTLPDTETTSILETFVHEMLYGNSNSEGEECLYNKFMHYELFYGPQTAEQMRCVLEDYKNLVRETVYVDFAKSYDHPELETAIQIAHAEMDSWWDEYLSRTNE